MDYLDYLGRAVSKVERKEQVKLLETELGFPLPQSLKTFYIMYQINDFFKYGKGDHLRFNYLVLDIKTNSFDGMALQVSWYKDVGYDPSMFYDFQDIKTVIRDFFNDDYELYEKDFIVIGETSWRFPIMVGINTENNGKIFVFNRDNNHLEFISDNIFEYLMEIELDFSNNYGLPEGKTMADLYRNWNEDFWRVREEEA